MDFIDRWFGPILVVLVAVAVVVLIAGVTGIDEDDNVPKNGGTVFTVPTTVLRTPTTVRRPSLPPPSYPPHSIPLGPGARR
jgi:hypothetical protein